MRFAVAQPRRHTRVAALPDGESDNRRRPKPGPASDPPLALALSTSNNACVKDLLLPQVWEHLIREQGRKERTTDKLTHLIPSQLREWRGREQTTCYHHRRKE